MRSPYLPQLALRKSLAVAAAFALASGTLNACSTGNPSDSGNPPESQSAPTSTAADTRTVTDLLGREVEIDADVKKIIAIPWPWSSFIFALDGKPDRIEAMSSTALASYQGSMFERLAPGLSAANTGFIDDANKDQGTFGTINVEEMAELDPDVALIYKREAEAMLAPLELAQIPTVVLDYGGLKEVQDGLRVVGEILGDEQKQRAEMIIGWHTAMDDDLGTRLSHINTEDKPRVLLFRDDRLTIENSKYASSLITSAGGIPVSESAQAGLSTVSFEQILEWDPDIILFGNFSPASPTQVFDNSMAGQDWSQLNAVQEKKVYKVPEGIYRWDPPSTEAHLFQLWLAKIMHPDAVEGVSLEEHTREFYAELFNHSLSPGDVDLIFHAEDNRQSAPIKFE